MNCAPRWPASSASLKRLKDPAKDDPEAQAKFLGIMREQANRMTRLVQDLLSLSRIELDEHAPPGRTDDLESLLAATRGAAWARRRRPARNARILLFDAAPCGHG